MAQGAEVTELEAQPSSDGHAPAEANTEPWHTRFLWRMCYAIRWRQFVVALLIMATLQLFRELLTQPPSMAAPWSDCSWTWFSRHRCLPLATAESSKPNPSGDDDDGGVYLLGTGKADVTGPVVEINLMGYADPNQIGSGLRQRLYSRAFIVGDVDKPADRFVYLVLDSQSGDTAVRYGILDSLRRLGPEYAVYGHHNIAVTGTHSHSGPGGWLNYLLPQITSKGFDRQGFRALVDGATLSIQRAHESLQPGYLSISTAAVEDGNINRSLFAYLANPATERARYNTTSEGRGDDGSVDRDLTLLKFTRKADMKSIGVLTWFATHGTSMLGNNTLVTGDNKGVAAYLFEKSAREGGDSGIVDMVTDGFVAGFSQANVGDTSPNVLGAWCEDGTGLPCSFETSTCSEGKSQTCHARGPLFQLDNTGTASCFEIGRRQFDAARVAYGRLAHKPQHIRGPWVRSFHTFHDMSNFTFALPNGTVVRTCPAALGYSFAAGTSDGPGVVNFTQHDSDPSNTSPVWRAVSHFLKSPSYAQRACHGSKPILLDVGELDRPYQWTPNVVDIQLFRVGQLTIIISPGEATTMAGRRWRDAVADAYSTLPAVEEIYDGRGNQVWRTEAESVVVLGGPANSYTHYITTEEEYAIQRYEGASTLYGPHTLAAYINVTLSYLPYLLASSSQPPPDNAESFPPDNSNRSLSFITGVIRDAPPLFKAFGDVTQDVQDFYHRGAWISAKFVGANPRNNLRLEQTFAAVEQLAPESSRQGRAARVWKTVRDDHDWSLVFRWRRLSDVLATSEAEIVWETEEWAEPGIYRIRYYGDAKALGGKVTSFEGVTQTFVLE